MKLIKLAPVASIFALLLAACGGPEGTYKLDKEAIKKAMEAEAKSDDEKKALEFASKMIEAMDVTLELKSDGTADMKTSMKLGEKAEEKSEPGKWTKDGDTITITGGKDGKDVKCKHTGGGLECDAGEKKGPKLIFKKS
jgi:hypothetical protein